MSHFFACQTLINEFLDCLMICTPGSVYAKHVRDDFVQREEFQEHADGILEMAAGAYEYRGYSVAEWKLALIRVAAKQVLRANDQADARSIPGYGIF